MRVAEFVVILVGIIMVGIPEYMWAPFNIVISWRPAKSFCCTKTYFYL